MTWVESTSETNRPKHRYANVVAYDHSRVVLSQPPDFINASWCHGYRRRCAYIATQVHELTSRGSLINPLSFILNYHRRNSAPANNVCFRHRCLRRSTISGGWWWTPGPPRLSWCLGSWRGPGRSAISTGRSAGRSTTAPFKSSSTKSSTSPISPFVSSWSSP